MQLIDRTVDTQNLREATAHAPVTPLTGPRQAGKSTLARQTVSSSPAAFFDLEDHRDLARLAEPTLALRDTGETIVIDEAQRMPELFPTLRVLVDENRRLGRFVVLGSTSPDLIGLGSEGPNSTCAWRSTDESPDSRSSAPRARQCRSRCTAPWRTSALTTCS